MDGQAVEGADRVGHHVVAIQVPGHQTVERGLRHFGVTDLIPRAGRDEVEYFDPVDVWLDTGRRLAENVPCGQNPAGRFIWTTCT